MKNKPIRHKEDNTFKFQLFSERIANIDIDIFHRVPHPNEEDYAEFECFFYQSLQKWNVLNLTENYESVRKELFDIVTLPQLLHKKEYIVEVLLKHLKLKNSLALQPILEFVVALAKDLRKEFYPYFLKFLNQLIELLNTKDTEQLEWIFTCLAYLFKFLWRYVIKDINAVFISLLPLLSDSRPPYINNFAAESFSYVARKVKDRETFLSLLLEAVGNKRDAVTGCGKLLFDVVRGIPGHLHSCAESTFSFYFKSLSNENLSQDILNEVLQQLISYMSANIQPRNSEIFWKTLFCVIDEHTKLWQNSRTEKLAKVIELLLQLACQAIEFKQGRLLNSPNLAVQEYIKLIAINEFPENVLLMLSKFGSLLLMSKNVQLQQEQASMIVRKTLLITNKNVILDFVEKLINYSSFEVFVLPTFLKYYKQTLDPQAYRILTKIILQKSPLSQDGMNLSSWTKYPLEFSNSSTEVLNHVLKFLIFENVESIHNMDEYICTLICLPHINYLNVNSVTELLRKNISIIHEELQNKSGRSNIETQKLIFLLAITIECLVHIAEPNVIYKLITETNCLDTLLELCNDISYVLCALKLIDLLITAAPNTQIISFEILQKLNWKLLEFYSSPYHQIRLLTTHIFSMYENLPELNQKTSSETWMVFSLCYNTEKIEPLVHTYRDLLNNLQKLSHEKSQSLLCNETEFSTVPLRYLLGVLYMNFQLLWKPVSKIIVGYAHNMPVKSFWEIYSQKLYATVENIHDGIDTNVEDVNTECNFITELYSNMFKLTDKPDFVNYRILLWNAMSDFSDVAEARSRDISTLMLNFIKDEYQKNNTAEALTCDIKEKSLTNGEALESDEEENEDILKIQSNPRSKYSAKVGLKILISHLKLFTNIRNPKALYREPELYSLYLELLSHRNADVQKTALDCIMIYKHKYLSKYKENLYGLIDEKRFKNEISLFRIDKDTTIVQEEHRTDLIPLVLRIVYSKMMAKTGMRTGGKASGQFRRQLILRFLAGCHEIEMIQFIQMSFRFYSNYLKNDDPEFIVKTYTQNVDLEKFIPPKKLQSTLNLLTIIIEQFGGLMGNSLLRYLLNILFFIGATIQGALDQKQFIYAGYLPSLKNVSTSCTTIISRIFARFESYPWSGKEINAIFDLFVWPWLDKLITEGVYSPTALLKLFHQWSQNTRYFPLLVKHENTNKEKCVLQQVIHLLITRKVHPSVTNTILEMLEKLLVLVPDELTETAPQIKIESVIPVAEHIIARLNLNQKLNYGSCILLPFIPTILNLFKKKLTAKSRGFNQRELFILSRISELVWEPETCDNVLALLLPLVVKRASSTTSEETIMNLIETVCNLMKYINAPFKHLKGLAPLFCETTLVQTRKALCNLLGLMRDKCTNEQFIELSNIQNILTEMNAFDKKWLDQPDYQRRHDAFKKVSKHISDNSIQMELGVIVIYNCFYVIRNDNDIALRECATVCLRELVPHLTHKYKSSSTDREYLINDVLFRLIKKGFSTKNEHYKREAISLLGHMARECSDTHPVLRDLSKFTNKVDLEVDVFENLLHLQLYRQTKALNKFNQISAELDYIPTPKTLTQFMLPLVSFYLLTEKYAQKNSLIDASIECVKTICRLLPWRQYETILKFYLKQLRYKHDYKKQLVRLVVSILDAYHYDISKAKLDEIDFETVRQETKITDKTEGNNESVEYNEDNISKNLDEENDIGEILEDVEEVEENESVVEQINVPAMSRQSILCPSVAKRVVFSIKTVLLPQLNRTMAEMTYHEGSHKINRRKTGMEREEEELQKVPLALAVVKLLQRLPTRLLEQNLPGIFMKLCTFLKSRLDSVRRLTRETLQQIMNTLGPAYLGLLISEMSALLSRGFQVHVLVYTIHAVLTTLKDSFKPTDIDKCLLTILEVCKADLFGNVAEEKEVAKIISKVSEAKSTKSYDTLQILAQCITEKCLMDLLLPLKEVLTQSHSYKIVNKVHEGLRRIVLGLVDNTFIPVNSLLAFAFGTASESIPQFIAANTKPKPNAADLEKKQIEKPDCFIIPALPVYRSGARANSVRKSTTTNAHLLVEFGLRLCYFVLKRGLLNGAEYAALVDPFVPVFTNCLSSRHVKMCTLTIQCLGLVMKYELPSMKINISDITISIFQLLHKFAAAGLSKGDNFDLVVAAFKTMAILIRDVNYYKIDNKQLRALLLYVEQDLHDYDRQATAFGLLKAIISRKLTGTAIYDVMRKVAELSITSDMEHVRVQCRQVFLQYLMDYPIGKRLEQHLAFYLSQLKYQQKPGRESAIELLQSVIESFPIDVLKEQADMFFIMIGARLVNDDDPNCRKKIAKCIQRMLERLTKEDRDSMFDLIKVWFKDKKINHRRLAAQLCGIMISVEESKFSSRVPELLPLIKAQLCPHLDDDKPGKFVKIAPPKEHNSDQEDKSKDYHLFQLLQMMLKLCSHCPFYLEHTEDLEIISQYVQTLLAYPHEWVRIAAAQFIGYILAVTKIDQLSNLIINDQTEKHGYLYSDPQGTLKSLTLDLCAQLQPDGVKEDLVEQVIKNLVFVARVLANVPSSIETKLNLAWLVKRVKRVVNREIIETPKSVVIRTGIFKWIAAIVTAVNDVEQIKNVLNLLLLPLVRQMTLVEQSNEALKQLAIQVAGLLKKKVGTDAYINEVSKIQMHLNARRVERKRERLQLAVTNPEGAAKKKLKIQEKKKLTKKRKKESLKGTKYNKKKRRTLEVEDSDLV